MRKAKTASKWLWYTLGAVVAVGVGAYFVFPDKVKTMVARIKAMIPKGSAAKADSSLVKFAQNPGIVPSKDALAGTVGTGRLVTNPTGSNATPGRPNTSGAGGASPIYTVIDPAPVPFRPTGLGKGHRPINTSILPAV